MDLGKFSLSLTVKDIDKSIQFYTLLGFKIIDGGHVNESFKDNETMKWRILENSSVKIGLFQGMFDQNILSFYPVDLMAIQSTLIETGITLIKEAKEEDSMKSAIMDDPDGNQIMLEQLDTEYNGGTTF
jgi:predicted lactoylglutathione lyase